MRKRLAVLLSVGIIFILSSCRPAPAGEFAIYLPAKELTGPQVAGADLRNLSLQSKPTIAAGDILAYDPTTHTMQLTPAAAQRLAQLKVGVYGRAFIVCVGTEPIYAGAFWSPVSSVSFNGVIIELPARVEDELALTLGYPTAAVSSGTDPRSDQRILTALRRAGKLK